MKNNTLYYLWLGEGAPTRKWAGKQHFKGGKRWGKLNRPGERVDKIKIIIFETL